MHQSRSCLHCLTEKDKQDCMADLKPGDQALNQEEGYENLLQLEQKWGKKYPIPVQDWLENGDMYEANLKQFRKRYLLPG